MKFTEEINFACVVKEMLRDDLLWLFGHLYTNFIHFHAMDYYFGSPREGVPHGTKLIKMAKIKCVNQVVSLEICMGDPITTPPCPLSVKLAK